ncbi:MAG: phosphodiester glycosidase family protein [Bacteroidia bacterium]|nr:phosphodiester glycosidase family protein [Bacteroidia bacterium]
MRLSFKYLIVISYWAVGLTAVSQDTLDLYPVQKGSLVCWTETRAAPRPLKIYYLRLDLSCPDLEVVTMTGADPDGNVPAESTLTLPGDLVSSFRAMAAINANAFAGLPGTENDNKGWYLDRPVMVLGMAVTDGRVISRKENGRITFWIDSEKHPHIGEPKPGDSIRQAVSDWSSPLILNGRIIPDSTFTTLHPRSALGFDDSGKWLLLVVVDGRQPGFSEGINLYELAALFNSKGCTQSINLDGGGSSIMLIRKPNRKIETVNSPSGILHRPVPVMLGIRKIIVR